MEITFTVKLLDLVRFNIYHASRRLLHWVVIAILVGMVARAAPPDASLKMRVLVSVVAAVLITGVMFLSTAIIAALSYRPAKNRAVLGEHKLSLSATTLTETTPLSNSTWSWSGVPKVSQNRSYIFIYVQQNSAHVIPKRAFTSAEEAGRFYQAALQNWKSSVQATTAA